MAVKYSKGTEIFKKQSDVYTRISQIQIRTDSNNPDPVKIPRGGVRWEHTFVTNHQAVYVRCMLSPDIKLYHCISV